MNKVMTRAIGKPVVVRTRRQAAVFVCRKCLKRSDDAKQIKQAIKTTLKANIGRSTRTDLKPARVIATSCFGLCPKNAIVITGGACAGTGDYVLISSADQVPAALARLQNDTTWSGPTG
jgi:predicted metal-binding protein